MWFVHKSMTTVILIPCCLVGAYAQLDWLFLPFPEMPAKHLDFPSLSLMWMGSMCSRCPFTVQMARYEAAYPALWDQSSYVSYCPAIAKKAWAGPGCRWAWSVCSGGFLVDLLSCLSAAVPQAGVMVNHQHLRACCSMCLWATSSLKSTSYLSNGRHQSKLLKARHWRILPRFLVKGENWSLWDLLCIQYQSGNQYQSSIGFA